jgi:hypothetical protein
MEIEKKKRPPLHLRLLEEVEYGVEKPVKYWAEHFGIDISHVHVLLTTLRRKGNNIFSVKRDSGEFVVTKIDRKTYSEEDADELARVSDQVSANYHKEINSKFKNLLRAMDGATKLYPMLEPEVKRRLIETAQNLIQYDYEQFKERFLENRGEASQLPAPGPEATA